MNVVDEIKDRIDIAEVISESVKLRKSGKNFTGFCPFHPNTRTPAFAVFPDTGTWRCFGACNEGGDVFNFLMKKEGWDFPETLAVLAKRTGVELRPRTQAEQEQDETRERLREILEAVVVYFRNNLRAAPEGESVLDYLHERSLSDETIDKFEIGFAMPSWDGAQTFLLERGFAEKDILNAGVLSKRETGGTYDRFRNRVMIPIRDARGRMAGFGARVLDPDEHPKYLNSPQTLIFDKGRLLYGLDRARKAIRSADQAVIVEGYMDVISLQQAGFQNVVSAMGTALSVHQLRLVKRYTRNIVLALDPDLAGSQATLRGLNVAREAMDREADPSFDARGLLRYESRLDADIRVVTLPEGKDPDEVVAEDPSAWPVLLKDAQPIVHYVFKVLSAGRDLDDPKVKADLAKQILPLIEDVADRVEREAYRQFMARRLKVDERALLGLRSRPRKPRARSKPTLQSGLQPEGKGQRDSPLERFCVGVLLENPELLYRIDRQLQTLELERLTPGDFTGTERQEIFHAIQAALAQDDQEPSLYWREYLGELLGQIAEEILSELAKFTKLSELSMDHPKVIDEISARFLQLRKRNLDAELMNLHFLMQIAEEEGTGEVERLQEFKEKVSRLAVQKSHLERALARRQGFIRTVTTGPEW